MTSHSWCSVLALTNHFCQVCNKNFQTTANCTSNRYCVERRKLSETHKIFTDYVSIQKSQNKSKLLLTDISADSSAITEKYERLTSQMISLISQWEQNPWSSIRSESAGLCIWHFLYFLKCSAKAWSPASILKLIRLTKLRAGTNLVTL